MKVPARILTGFTAILLTVHLLVAPALSTASAAPPPPGLLSEAPPDGEDPVTGLPAHPAERRTRRARLNLNQLPDRARGLALQSQAAALRFNLFPDVDLLGEIEASGDAPLGGAYLHGSLAGLPFSEWTLIDRDGTVAISIHAGDRYYQVTPLADGDYAVQEIDVSALPPEAEPLLPDLPADLPADTNAALTLSDAGSPVIDVMVVYTPAARAGAGDIAGLINLAVTETNIGYQNSQINQRVRVVHTAEVNYSETGLNWGNALDQLTRIGDGVLDEVHNLRDRYGADAVVLLVASPGYTCGIGWLMNPMSPFFASHAFTVVALHCATGYYSFAHELGHIMGATHDRANAGGNPGAFPYSYGYQDPGGAFRTIMAYDCPGYCPRINHWSNPDVFFGGRPTGVNAQSGNSADNRLTLNQTAAIVAGFRVSLTDFKHRAYLPQVVR